MKAKQKKQEELKSKAAAFAAMTAEQKIKDDPMNLSKMTADERDNEDLIRLAVKKNGHAFVFASKRLREDFNFVTEICKIDNSALMYASDGVQKEFRERLRKLREMAAKKQKEDEEKEFDLKAVKEKPKMTKKQSK